MRYNITKAVIIILIFLVIGAVILNEYSKKVPTITNSDNIITNQTENTKICYYNSTSIDEVYYDESWIKLYIVGDKVTGEFNTIPAQKDSKVGTFEGTVTPLGQATNERYANVWWDSFAEGMKVKEELSILFGDVSASIGGGELIDRGDGVYIYKDKSNLKYLNSLNQIDCKLLNEKISIQKYIRDNIKTIATNKPVLGGSWYVLSVNAIPATHTGKVTYEDGHMQSQANFTYTYDEKSQSVSITKWEIE